MFRSTLDANSPQVSMFVTTANGPALKYRSTVGGTTGSNQTAGLLAPYWVKVTRTGNVFKAYRSADLNRAAV